MLVIAVTIFSVGLGMIESSQAQEGWNEFGVRTGIQAGPKREYFHLYEIYAVYGLPWEWRSGTGWGIDSQLNTSLGSLHTAADTGVIGSLGTGVTVTKAGFNLVPEAGINVNLTDKRQFGKQDFGSVLLFGAYLGLSYRFDSGFGIGYRMLHLSNGHIVYSKDTPNPGLDLHMIGISWHF
jgi:hypothetical protein